MVETLRFHLTCIYHSITFMVLVLYFHTKDPVGVVETANIFLFTELYPVAGSEAALLARY